MFNFRKNNLAAQLAEVMKKDLFGTASVVMDLREHVTKFYTRLTLLKTNLLLVDKFSYGKEESVRKNVEIMTFSQVHESIEDITRMLCNTPGIEAALKDLLNRETVFLLDQYEKGFIKSLANQYKTQEAVIAIVREFKSEYYGAEATHFTEERLEQIREKRFAVIDKALNDLYPIYNELNEWYAVRSAKVEEFQNFINEHIDLDDNC